MKHVGLDLKWWSTSMGTVSFTSFPFWTFPYTLLYQAQTRRLLRLSLYIRTSSMSRVDPPQQLYHISLNIMDWYKVCVLITIKYIYRAFNMKENFSSPQSVYNGLRWPLYTMRWTWTKCGMSGKHSHENKREEMWTTKKESKGGLSSCQSVTTD